MTHTTKHTPGPWGRIVELGCDVYAISKDPESHTFVAECAIEEDARFIAAAPAMYEALTHALSVCEAEAELRGENDIDDYLGGAAGPVARMIRAALAQANGE